MDSEIFYMSFDAMNENDSKNVSIGIYGKKKVSVDLIQKIQESIKSKLVELTAMRISSKLLSLSSSLQPSELNFLKDRTRRQVDMTLFLPSFVHDPMHFCVVARQLFLCSQIFIAPLSSYNTERREKRPEEERERKTIEDRERDYNRLQLSTISHPSALGYNLYDSESNGEATKDNGKLDVKLNADFRPMLKRNKHVDSFWGDPKKCHPVFFENILNVKKRPYEGKLVIWNQNDFTFLYNEMERLHKTPKRSVSEIGQGLVLMEFSIIQDSIDNLLPGSALFIASKRSIERDIRSFDNCSVHSVKGDFSMSLGENSDLNSGPGIKICIYPTTKMTTKGLSEFCVSLFNEALKIYLFERSCLLHTVNSCTNFDTTTHTKDDPYFAPSTSTLQTSSLYSDPSPTAGGPESTVLVTRLNKILWDSVASGAPRFPTGKDATDHVGTLGHHSYHIKLPKMKALDLHKQIVSIFLSQNSTIDSFQSSLCIDPRDLSFNDGHLQWCDVFKSDEASVNITLFSDIFEGNCSAAQENEQPDVRILPEEFGSTATQLLPVHLRRKHFMLEIITTPSGLHIFHYNVSQFLVTSLRKTTETLVQSISKQNVQVLGTLGLSKFSLIRDAHGEDEYEEVKNISTQISWSKKRLLRLLPRESESKIAGSSDLSVIPHHAWKRGRVVRSAYIPLPTISASHIGRQNELKEFKKRVHILSGSLCDVELIIYPEVTIILYIIPFSSSVHIFEIRSVATCTSVEVIHRIADSFDIISSLMPRAARNIKDTFFSDRSGNHCICNLSHAAGDSFGELSYFSSVIDDKTVEHIYNHIWSFPLGVFYDNILRSRRDNTKSSMPSLRRFRELLR